MASCCCSACCCCRCRVCCFACRLEALVARRVGGGVGGGDEDRDEETDDDDGEDMDGDGDRDDGGVSSRASCELLPDFLPLVCDCFPLFFLFFFRMSAANRDSSTYSYWRRSRGARDALDTELLRP